MEVIVIVENEGEYSAYGQTYSNSSTIWALFAGFTFAAITIVLTQHPDPSQQSVQMTLFIFAFMLFLFLYNLSGANIAVWICVRTAPPAPEKWKSMEFQRTQNLFMWIGWVLLGFSIVFMYLLWNLYCAALASSVVGLLFLALGYIHFIKPSKEYSKKHPWTRK